MAPITQTIPKAPAVLLLGNYRPALAVARALTAVGYRITMGRHGDEGGCELSAHVSAVWDHPPLDRGRGVFLASLERYLERRGDIGIVFPVAEEFVNLFAEALWTPPQGRVLVGPGHQNVLQFTDKIDALRAARRLNVPTLPFELVHTHQALLKSAEQIGYPITVRPLGSTARIGHKKALIAATPDQLRQALPQWPPGHEVLLLQGFAAGQRHNIYFAARDGKLLGVVESCITRTNHPDGTGLAVCGETVTPAQTLVRDTGTLVSACGYTGIGLAQFIVDPKSGERCFLELNPRVSGSHAVPEYAGMGLSVLAVNLARDVKITGPNTLNQGREGLRYVWTSGDLAGIKLAFIRGEIDGFRALYGIIEAVRDAFTADAHLIWSRDDPKPGLRALAGFLPKFTRIRAKIRALRPWRKFIIRTTPHTRSGSRT